MNDTNRRKKLGKGKKGKIPTQNSVSQNRGKLKRMQNALIN